MDSYQVFLLRLRMNTEKRMVTTSPHHDKPVRAHVFTNIEPGLFYKQLPSCNKTIDGVTLSVGMDVPEDIDVLLVFTRSSYSIPTRLPRERTVFVAGEPDVIHPYNTRFLNQFGIVLTPSEKAVATEKWKQNYCSMWFVGVDFSKPRIQKNLKGYDWLASLKPPPKKDKISIVTSNKTFTEFHRRRLKFIEELQTLIPEHLEILGRGFRSIGDKAEALLPYRYHLALENGGGRFTWSEKLSDPLLCWTFSFYAGCENVEEDLPVNSFACVDLNDPSGSAELMVRYLQNRQWWKSLDAISDARELLLHKYNLVFLLARLAKSAMAKPISNGSSKKRLIRSERSLWPDRGGRGSVGEWMLRSTLLMFDPRIELKAWILHKWIAAKRIRKRERRIAELERQQN